MDQFTFTIICPGCNQRIKCAVRHIGRENKCPNCQQRFHISDPIAVPVEHHLDRSSEVSSHVVWNVTETKNRIDDSIVRTAKVATAEDEGGLFPTLVCRAKLKGCSISRDVYVTFPKKVFSIRDELSQATLRFDNGVPFRSPILSSETGFACLFQNENDLFHGMQKANQVLIELLLMQHGTHVFKFDVHGFGSVYRQMYEGAVSADMKNLVELNQDLVDHVFRIGPKNLQALIEVLLDSELLSKDQLNNAGRKGCSLFSAVQAFGELHHVSEIYGEIEDGTINDPFPLVVYNSLTEARRNEIGQLLISD